LLDNPLDKPMEEESMMARARKGIGSDPLITHQEQQQQERRQALASQRRKPKQKSASALEHSNVQNKRTCQGNF
jgi:hypothetical protein